MSKMKKILALMLILVLGTMVLTGCFSEKADNGKEVVKIGFLAPLSGYNGLEGQIAQNAVELAIDQYNNDPSAKYFVKLVAMDDESNSEKALAAAKEMTKDSSIMAVIGGYNLGVAQNLTKYFADNKMPFMLWAANANDLLSEDTYPYVSRIMPSKAQNANAILNKVYNLGHRNFYLVVEDNAEGESIVNNAKTYMSQLKNAKIVGAMHTPEGVDKSAQILDEVKKSQATAVVFAGAFEQASQVKSQLVETNMSNVLVCGTEDLATKAFLVDAGDYSEGTVAIKSGIPLDGSESGKKVLEAYKNAGYDKPLTPISTYAYDSAKCIFSALNNVEKLSRENVANAIVQGQHIGTYGKIAFDNVGQCLTPTTYLVVAQNGKWQRYYSSKYANDMTPMSGKWDEYFKTHK